MTKNIFIKIIFCLSLTALIFSSCSNADNSGALKDGQYRAEYKEFDDHGWKDYAVVTISDGKYTTVEFDSVNKEDGRKKSEDKEYMAAYPKDGNFVKPDEYTRRLEDALLEKQDIENVDAISTATTSSESFKKLINSLTINMKRGKSETVIVDNQS